MTDAEFRQTTTRSWASIASSLSNAVEILKAYDTGQAEMLLILKDLTSAVGKLGGDPPDHHRGNGKWISCHSYGRDARI